MGDDAEHPTNVIPAPIASEASNREQKLWGAGGEVWHLRRLCV
jgi:hypothetical protein